MCLLPYIHLQAHPKDAETVTVMFFFLLLLWHRKERWFQLHVSEYFGFILSNNFKSLFVNGSCLISYNIIMHRWSLSLTFYAIALHNLGMEV